MLFFHFRVYGSENIPPSGGFVLACNHQSFLDPLFCGIGIKRQLCFMARASLFTHWLFGRILRSVKAIPVKRGQADLGAIKEVIAKLKDGEGVCLFPEGTRSVNGRISQVKPGLALLSRRSGAPVIPVAVDGAFECWPRHQKIFTPFCRIVVRYGSGISAEQIEKMTDSELAKKLTAALRELQNRCRITEGKKPLIY